MPQLPFFITIQDSNAGPGVDNCKTGLTLAWRFFKNAITLADITPQPTFTEVGNGVYRILYDPETNGEAISQVDAGASLTSGSDRYISWSLTKDSLRILTALPAFAPNATNGLLTRGQSPGQLEPNGVGGLDVFLQPVDRPWESTGTAQAGGASSITLRVGDSALTNAYVGKGIRLVSGTGAGQSRICTAYNGTTKVATVDRPWATQPDNQTVYATLSHPAVDANANADALLDRADGIETGWTLRMAARIWSAVLGGTSSNGGKTFRSLTGTKARVTSTVDSSKNRTAVTYDPN